MKEELTISLPPQGSLLREYIKTAFYYADYSDPLDEITPTVEGFTIKCNNVRNSLSESIRLAVQTLNENSHQNSSKSEFPFHSNDKRWKTIDRIKDFICSKKIYFQSYSQITLNT